MANSIYISLTRTESCSHIQLQGNIERLVLLSGHIVNFKILGFHQSERRNGQICGGYTSQGNVSCFNKETPKFQWLNTTEFYLQVAKSPVWVFLVSGQLSVLLISYALGHWNPLHLLDRWEERIEKVYSVLATEAQK